jgi:predicted nuclease of restriction endonuclease-like RecB superfamily
MTRRDGPISLFKLTEKYGSAFAKLLPTIMSSAKWCLKANITKKTAQGKRVYDFALDHTKKGIFGAELGTEEAIGFDTEMANP